MVYNILPYAPVAQLDRALVSGTKGRGFDSLRAYHDIMQNTPKLIGISGGSCSGKTILGNSLADRLGNRLTRFSFDDMYVGHAALAGKNVTDWESPALYRWDDFVDHLRTLKDGRPTEIIANESPERDAPEKLTIHPRPIVAVFGFLTLHNPEARELFDTTIYLDVPEDEIIRRRLNKTVPSGPWDSKDYVTGPLIEGHRRVVVPQRALAEHVLDATAPPDQVVTQAEAVIRGQLRATSV